VWVSNGPKHTVGRLDPKTNTVMAHIAVGKEPCSGLAVGFGSLWVPCCGDASLVRVDLKTGRGHRDAADRRRGTPRRHRDRRRERVDDDRRQGTLARIDPSTNKVVAEIYVAPGSFAVAFGEGAVW
jgi:YVTN family beta-propeller protein